MMVSMLKVAQIIELSFDFLEYKWPGLWMHPGQSEDCAESYGTPWKCKFYIGFGTVDPSFNIEQNVYINVNFEIVCN
jgi:hypothetical protein